MRSGLWRGLKSDNAEARHAIKVAEIVGANRVAELKCTRSNDEVAHRHSDTFRSLLAADAGDDFGRCIRHRMAWNGRLELVKKKSPPISATVSADKTIGTSPTTRRTLSIASAAVSFRRSAAIKTLESSTNPRRADSMARVAR